MCKNIPMFISILVMFASCNNSHLETKYTEELSYTLNDAGTGYYVSNGTNVDKVVYVPSFYNGLPVIGVNYGGFSYSNYMIDFEEIRLPETIIEIKSSAFLNCEKLKNINFPESLEIIGSNAFLNCKSIEKVILPNGIKIIGECAFDNMISLKKIQIPNSAEYVSYIKSSYVANVVTSLIANYHNNGYYYGNDENPYLILDMIYSNTNEFKVSENCKFYAISDYISNKKIEKIVLSNSVEYLSSRVTIPGLKQIIGDCKIKGVSHNTFKQNRGLVEIPTLKFCKFIGYSAFEECIKLPGKIDLSSIEELQQQAFYNCESIEEVILGKQLKTISENVFGRCKTLKKIYIPKSVKNIEYRAFYGCDSIQNIYYEGSADEWNLINIHSSNNSYLSFASVTYNCSY